MWVSVFFLYLMILPPKVVEHEEIEMKNKPPAGWKPTENPEVWM